MRGGTGFREPEDVGGLDCTVEIDLDALRHRSRIRSDLAEQRPLNVGQPEAVTLSLLIHEVVDRWIDSDAGQRGRRRDAHAGRVRPQRRSPRSPLRRLFVCVCGAQHRGITTPNIIKPDQGIAPV